MTQIIKLASKPFQRYLHFNKRIFPEVISLFLLKSVEKFLLDQMRKENKYTLMLSFLGRKMYQIPLLIIVLVLKFVYMITAFLNKEDTSQ